ncbi:MAG: cysteine desulfurase [Lachnospiraceae bacterium]|nr:cysteine desulfurase [Lachnospiraceae bacterium]
MKEVYLDNSATTQAYEEVAEIMKKILTEDYGNPSSMHRKGIDAEKYLREAREIIAANLKCDTGEILFTSGGTESDNMALIGTAMANHRSGKHIITTAIEHPAILETAEHLKSLGFEITYLPVDSFGVVDPEELRKAIREDTILVSVMHTNNEIGSLQPIEEIGKIIKEIRPSILFHVDAVQGYGKFRILPRKMGIDLMSVSAHKIHGPKGIGFLYINNKVKIHPIIFGGGQQKGLRSGTENVPAIAGMAKAVSMIYKDLDEHIDKMYELKEHFVKRLLEIDGVTINGHTGRDSAPHVISASFEGVRAEVLLHALEDKQIYVSSGSACASNKPAVSSTLKAIGVKNGLLDSTIRFSLSVFTEQEELDHTVDVLNELLPVLRRFTRH